MSSASEAPIGYGLIGAGAFGRFCAGHYAQMDELRTVAVADRDPHAAKAAAKETGLDPCDSVEQLLARNDVDLVHIATPPFTHRDLVTQALEAGKHVLCEKPLATTLDDARAMVELAQKQQRVLAVNLIMRYNPLCEIVRQIVNRKLLGEPLHGFFENYAKDEPLSADHWFWRKDLSGGIFVEHGVHFFDLFAGWLGDGRCEGAAQVVRPGAEFVEQVSATIRYRETVLVHFYHGFTQATRMDRQEFRLLFERGTVRLFEWVPTSIEIDALATEADRDALAALLPDARTETTAEFGGDERRVESRHKRYEVDGRYRLTSDVGMDKPALYGHVVRQLLADQIAAIRDPSHRRRVTESNGVTSLEMAVDATRCAGGGEM
jgi:predicted dehydrogenase